MPKPYEIKHTPEGNFVYVDNIERVDISDFMRILNYLNSENQQLKNELADLKVKYKQILEENRVLKVEKHRLFQKNTNLMKQIKEILK